MPGSLQAGAILDNVSLTQKTEIHGVPEPVAMILLGICFIDLADEEIEKVSFLPNSRRKERRQSRLALPFVFLTIVDYDLLSAASIRF